MPSSTVGSEACSNRSSADTSDDPGPRGSSLAFGRHRADVRSRECTTTQAPGRRSEVGATASSTATTTGTLPSARHRRSVWMAAPRPGPVVRGRRLRENQSALSRTSHHGNSEISRARASFRLLASRTCPRPGAAGARLPRASFPCSGPKCSCPGSVTYAPWTPFPAWLAKATSLSVRSTPPPGGPVAPRPARPARPVARSGSLSTKCTAWHPAPGARPAALPSPTPAVSARPVDAPQPCRG
jgi:hypothetical protein